MPFPSPDLFVEFTEINVQQAFLGSVTTLLVNYCVCKVNHFKQRNSALSQPKEPSDEDDSQSSQPVLMFFYLLQPSPFQQPLTLLVGVDYINLNLHNSDEPELPNFLNIDHHMTNQGAPYLIVSDDEMEHL